MDHAATGSKFQVPLSCRICKVTYPSEALLGPASLSRTVAERVIVVWTTSGCGDLDAHPQGVLCENRIYPRLHREALCM